MSAPHSRAARFVVGVGFAAACVIVFVSACGGPDSAPQEASSVSPDASAPAAPQRSELNIGGVEVTVVAGANPRADVLVLPGWKHRRTRWLDETSLDETAARRGFRLICPEMGVSIYASQYFPETTRRWDGNDDRPGLVYMRDVLVPELRRQGYMTPESSFVLGLSTGARGAALMALERPQWFRAVAALSGDYDQSLQPKDRLMTAVYGAHDDFPDRWKHTDNIVQRSAEWKLPLYLAHSPEDRIVPFFQSRALFDALRNAHGDRLNLVFDREARPEAGKAHDYGYWDAHTNNVFDFFERHL